MNIVIPDRLNLSKQFNFDMKKYHHVEIYDDLINCAEIIIERIKDAEIITANYIDITSEIIKEAKKLKYIISPAVGYDWIDIDTASKNAIKVLNCPTYSSNAVAEHAIALIMALCKNLLVSNSLIKECFWEPTRSFGREVFNKRLGLIGFGRIGQRVGAFGRGLGMKVSFVNSKSLANEVDDLIKESDILVLALPLNSQTKNLLNKG